MRWLGASVVVVSSLALVGGIVACGDDDAASPGGGGTSSGTSNGGTSSNGGPNDPGSTTDGGVNDPNELPPPAPSCEPPVTAADVSTPDSVLGAPGGPACDEAGLQTALTKGGVITFQCGGTAEAPFVLELTKELSVVENTEREVVIDGGGTVTLSGNKATRILHIGRDDNFEKATPKVTVQKLNFVDGRTTDVPATRETNKGGAAIYRLGGTLTVIDSKFVNNIGPTDGQDVAGGAIYSVGGRTTTIVGSSFSGNRCSNGGAVGNLVMGGLTIANTAFLDNEATGQNANPGNGGNGGALCFDGPSQTGGADVAVSLCGVTFARNKAGIRALGGAMFRTVNTTALAKKTAPLSIDRSTFDANESASAGAIYMHQVDLTITNSTFSRNVARAGAGGGIWAEGSTDGPAFATLNLTNVTVTGNVANEQLGGGFFIGTNVTGGELRHVTVANNEVATASGNQYLVFGAGIVGDVTKLKLTNSIFANNKKPALQAGESANCQPGGFIDGGGNFEFVNKDHPDPKRCVAGSTLEDPLLAPLADNEGPTQTMALTSSSPAAKKAAANCSPTDQRGKPRSAPCTAGAFEP